MICTNCCTDPCCCDPSCWPARSNLVPSPTPPWSRPTQVMVTETLSMGGNVSLTADPTYLDAAASSPSAPIAITIPNGSYKTQSKRIYVASARLATTETWILSGTFAGFTGLRFDAVGFSAGLEWDGAAWLFIFGQATTI